MFVRHASYEICAWNFQLASFVKMEPGMLDLQLGASGTVTLVIPTTTPARAQDLIKSINDELKKDASVLGTTSFARNEMIADRAGIKTKLYSVPDNRPVV
jgi:hypothetical protein